MVYKSIKIGDLKYVYGFSPYGMMDRVVKISKKCERNYYEAECVIKFEYDTAYQNCRFLKAEFQEITPEIEKKIKKYKAKNL